MSRVYLDVPYAEKDEARKRGAFWDKDVRRWYIHGSIGFKELLRLKRTWVPGVLRKAVYESRESYMLSANLFTASPIGVPLATMAHVYLTAAHARPSTDVMKKHAMRFDVLFKRLSEVIERDALGCPRYLSKQFDDKIGPIAQTKWFTTLRVWEEQIADMRVLLKRAFALAEDHANLDQVVLILSTISKANDTYPSLKENVELSPYLRQYAEGDIPTTTIPPNPEELDPWAYYEEYAYMHMSTPHHPQRSGVRTDFELLRLEVDESTKMTAELVDIVLGYVYSKSQKRVREYGKNESMDNGKDEVMDTSDEKSSKKRKRADDEDSEDDRKKKESKTTSICPGNGLCLYTGANDSWWRMEHILCSKYCSPIKCRVCRGNFQKWRLDENGGTCDECTLGKMDALDSQAIPCVHCSVIPPQPCNPVAHRYDLGFDLNS
jgi:hypothetical protein